MQRTADRLLELMHPKPVPDVQLVARVRAKLALLSSRPEAIHLSSEHGCVVLGGDCIVTERARIVREVARVPGVDSVVDLMQEHPAPVTHALAPRSAIRPWVAFARGRWSPTVRRVVAGMGAGLTAAGLKVGGKIGATIAVTGALLFARAVANARMRLAP